MKRRILKLQQELEKIEKELDELSEKRKNKQMTSLDYVTKYKELTGRRNNIKSEIKKLENDDNTALTVQKLCCESEEIVDAKLAIYEAFDANEITKAEKYHLLANIEEKCLETCTNVIVTEGALQNKNISVTSMLKIGAALTTINAIIAVIAKIRSNNKMIRENIEANNDLSRIETDLKNIQSRLYQQRYFISSKLNDVNRDIENANHDIDKYGNPMKKVITVDDEKLDINSDYNPRKADAARDRLDESNKIHDELIDSGKVIDRELSNIRSLKRELYRIAKKFGSDKEIEELDKRIEDAKNRVDKVIG